MNFYLKFYFLWTEFNNILATNLYLNANTLLFSRLYCNGCVLYRWFTKNVNCHKLNSENDTRNNTRSCRQKIGPQWALFGKSCTKEDTEWQKCFADGDGKGSTPTPVQFTQEACEDQQTEDQPGKTSKRIFEDFELRDVPKTSRNRILKTLAKLGGWKKASIVAETQGNEGQIGKKVHQVGYEARTDESRGNFRWPRQLGKVGS